MRPKVRRTAKALVNSLIPVRVQARLGRFLLDNANGDNDGEEEFNGEFYFQDQVIRHLRENGRAIVVFDVGANVGMWSKRFLERSAGPVTMNLFEPCGSVYAECSKLGGVRSDGSRVLVNRTAVSDRRDKRRLFVSADSAGSHSLFLREDIHNGQCGTDDTVETISLDEYCKEKGITRIDLVKIDTEGSELSVIRGSQGMLARHEIRFLQFEYGGTWIDAGIFLKEAMGLLMEKGYLIAKLHKSGVSICEGYDRRYETFQYANFIAVAPEERHFFDSMTR